MLEHVGCFESLPDLVSGSHQGNVVSLTHQLGLPDLEVLIIRGEVWHRLAAETDVDGTVAFEDGLLGGDAGLGGVTWRDYRHMRQHPHHCQILEGLVGSTVGAYRHTCVGAADDDMNVVVTGRDTDLVVGPMGGKYAVGAKHRYLTAQCQA